MNKTDWKKINYLSKKYKAIQYLGGCCKECGETNLFNLEFHHKDENTKIESMTILKNYRWSKIEDEIKKCELLCRNCHNKFHYGEDNTGRWKANKKIFLEFKGVDKCEKCGYNECNASLDFHHVNSDDKDFMLGDIYLPYNSIRDLTEKIENELNKCEVLCKNCHMIEHSDVEFYEKNKEAIIFKSLNMREIQSKVDRNKVKELYESGVKQIEISKILNTRKSTISGIIKELKLNKPF